MNNNQSNSRREQLNVEQLAVDVERLKRHTLRFAWWRVFAALILAGLLLDAAAHPYRPFSEFLQAVLDGAFRLF